MKIGRILSPVHELGPGNRLGIWVQGCQKRCPECANPELWDLDERKEIPIDLLTAIATISITSQGLSGITVTGGEPMLQAKELAQFLDRLKPICDDVLVFTGFNYKELKQSHDPNVHAALSGISVLVDGEYRYQENTGERLRGSGNQRIIFLKEDHRKAYEEYMNAENRWIDNFITNDGIIVAGIHPQSFLGQAWGTPPLTNNTSAIRKRR